MDTIRLDFGNLMAARVEGGVSEESLTGVLAERFT